jgi:SAM-dependent methyltransferase
LGFLTRSEEPGERVQASPDRVETHQSLGLRALFQKLRSDRKCHVLDLGTSVGINVEFLTEFASKIYIEDLYSTLDSSWVAAQNGELVEEPPFGEWLPFPKNTRFDIILSWNVLDYLKSEDIRALIRYLNDFCRPGTLLFALSSRLKEIPARPTQFKILDEQTLMYMFESSQMRPSPRHTPLDFTHMMVGFRVHNSFLLKHGMQEYLFIHE